MLTGCGIYNYEDLQGEYKRGLEEGKNLGFAEGRSSLTSECNKRIQDTADKGNTLLNQMKEACIMSVNQNQESLYRCQENIKNLVQCNVKIYEGEKTGKDFLDTIAKIVPIIAMFI